MTSLAPAVVPPLAASERWLGTDLESVGIIVASTFGIYIAVIALVRIRGLRSFSKMSAFDFAMAVAMGTILATTAVSPDLSLTEGIVAAAAFFTAHAVVSRFRRHFGGVRLIDNRPKLLVRDGRLIEGRLEEVGMSDGDLAAKLRYAGISSLSEVAMVVMETTGDISVLRRGDVGGPGPGDFILSGIDLD